MATEDGHEGRWVTMNGNHVFIRSNETIETALARDIKGGKEHGTRKEKQAEKPESKAQAHKKEYEKRKKEFYDKADPGGKLKGQMKGEMEKQPEGKSNDTKKITNAVDKWLDDPTTQKSVIDDLKNHGSFNVPANVKKDMGVSSYASDGNPWKAWDNKQGNFDVLKKHLGDKLGYDFDSGKFKDTNAKSVKGDPPPKGTKGFAGRGMGVDENDKPEGVPWKITASGYHTWDETDSSPAHQAMVKKMEGELFDSEKKEFEKWKKLPHGRVPSTDPNNRVYFPDDMETDRGRQQQILNHFDKHPSSTFDPWSSLPESILSRVPPQEWEQSMISLNRSHILGSGGPHSLGMKLRPQFRRVPPGGSGPTKAYSAANPHPARMTSKELTKKVKDIQAQPDSPEKTRFLKAYTKALKTKQSSKDGVKAKTKAFYDKADPGGEFKNKMKNFQKQQKGSMNKIYSSANSLKIASMKLQVKS